MIRERCPRLVSVVLDAMSSLVLLAGSAMLLAPVVLHLWLGADNDSYLLVAEGARREPLGLAQFGLERMFRIDLLARAALLVAVGAVVKVLLWKSAWPSSLSCVADNL
jgi:hypothetical protein